MEKMDFIENELIRLPPGFRFKPTEEELFQYLKCKVFSLPLPSSIIPEINTFCNYDPWDLPGNCELGWYFFSLRNGNRMNRTTKSGCWKETSEKQMSSTCNGIVGMRKTFTFYDGKYPNGSRTDWVLHEYRLVSIEPNAHKNNINQIGDWVLFHLFMKKKSTEGDDSTTDTTNGTKEKDDSVETVNEEELDSKRSTSKRHVQKPTWMKDYIS